MPDVNAGCFFVAKVELMGFKEIGGGWTKVDGIGMDLQNEEKEEGGNPLFRRLIMKGGLTYPKVTFTRPVDETSWKLRTVVAGFANKFLPVTASIELKKANGETITTWTLLSATIVAYKVSGLSISNSSLAEETITVHHQGFYETYIGFAGPIIALI